METSCYNECLDILEKERMLLLLGLDTESVVDIVCDWIKEDVEQEVCEMIGKLPQDILSKIKISKSDVNIESYLEPSEPEYDHHERDYDYGIASEMDVLDRIFK